MGLGRSIDVADEDRTDEALKSLGEVTRRRTAENSTTAGPECVEEDRLRAIVLAQPIE